MFWNEIHIPYVKLLTFSFSLKTRCINQPLFPVWVLYNTNTLITKNVCCAPLGTQLSRKGC